MQANKDITCASCGQKFDTQELLNTHIAEMHPENTNDAPTTGTSMPGMQGTPGAQGDLGR